MQYQVPQFIEVEDKIVGPMTLKQFIYLVGGAGLSYIIYVLIGSFWIAVIPIVLIMGLSAALAFYKVYDHFPLIYIIEYALRYFFGTKLYIWKKEDKPAEKSANAVEEAKKYVGLTVPKISDSKLKDLSWSLDIKESMYSNQNQK